jgi:hypothetical protein
VLDVALFMDLSYRSEVVVKQGKLVQELATIKPLLMENASVLSVWKETNKPCGCLYGLTP